MLTGLLRTYLGPYRSQLAGVVVLQLISVIAMLYLPSLNADLIDGGVTKGDIGYIWNTGLWMLAVSAVQIVASAFSVYLGAQAAMGAGRDLRGALLLSVNHSGDSDSTGAVAGNLLGALHGVAALPAEWASAVEGREVLLRVADDLVAAFVDGDHERVAERYSRTPAS